MAKPCHPTSPAATAASVHKPDRQVESSASRRSAPALEATVRPRDQTSLSRSVPIAEAPGLPLDVPDKRPVPQHLSQPQPLWLPSVEDRFDDVRREAGEAAGDGVRPLGRPARICAAGSGCFGALAAGFLVGGRCRLGREPITRSAATRVDRRRGHDRMIAPARRERELSPSSVNGGRAGTPAMPRGMATERMGW
jgi:hypothetical protein